MDKVIPGYSRSAVELASKQIRKGLGSAADLENARAVLSQFRSAHAFPLNAVTVTVRQKALTINGHTVITQRLKRPPTILDKLKRHPRMNVVMMQDLGGCRVIFPSLAEVDQLVRELRNAPRARNRIVRVYDYLRQDEENERSGPKPVGQTQSPSSFLEPITKHPHRTRENSDSIHSHQEG